MKRRIIGTGMICALLVTTVFGMTACQKTQTSNPGSGLTSETQTEAQTDTQADTGALQVTAEELFELKTAYVGDASAIGAILTKLSDAQLLPEGERTMEIQSDAEPYILRLIYKDDIAGKDKTQIDNLAYKGGAIILALVDNLSQVQFIFPDGTDEHTVYCDVNQMSKMLGGLVIKECGTSVEGMKQLLEAVPKMNTQAKEEGSTEKIDGAYEIYYPENKEKTGIILSFTKDGKFTDESSYQYEFKTEKGHLLLRMTSKDGMLSLAAVKADGKNLEVNFNVYEDESGLVVNEDGEKNVLTLQSGDEQLGQGKLADATYAMEGAVGYTWEFQKDGTMKMRMTSDYELNGNVLKMGDAEYFFEKDGDTIHISTTLNEPMFDLILVK